jgi:C4-type Zn-finger protein
MRPSRQVTTLFGTYAVAYRVPHFGEVVGVMSVMICHECRRKRRDAMNAIL